MWYFNSKKSKKAALKTTRQSKIIKYKSTVNLFWTTRLSRGFRWHKKSTTAKQCLNGMWQRPILPVRSRKNWENRRQTEEISYYAKKHARRHTVRIPRAFSESEYGRYFAWRRFYLFFRWQTLQVLSARRSLTSVFGTKTSKAFRQYRTINYIYFTIKNTA